MSPIPHPLGKKKELGMESVLDCDYLVKPLKNPRDGVQRVSGVIYISWLRNGTLHRDRYSGAQILLDLNIRTSSAYYILSDTPAKVSLKF